jgi:hypothetical protein
MVLVWGTIADRKRLACDVDQPLCSLFSVFSVCSVVIAFEMRRPMENALTPEGTEKNLLVGSVVGKI